MNLHTARRVVVILFLAGVMAGCSNSRKSGDSPAASSPPVRLDLATHTTEASLRPYVGQRVTVVGHWEGRGKIGSYVYGGSTLTAEVIYIRPTSDQGIAKQNQLYTIANDTLVEVTGVLQRYEEPPATQSGDEANQNMPSHFFFNVSASTVQPVGSSHR